MEQQFKNLSKTLCHQPFKKHLVISEFVGHINRHFSAKDNTMQWS